MAIDRTGINSLDAGATKSPSGSSIKYEGDIVEPQMKMAAWEGSPGMDSREEVRRAWKDYLKALQEGTFTGTWEQFMPLWIKGNLASAQGGMEPMSAAQGGRAGYRDGYSVQGGGPNYLGEQPTAVDAPINWQSSPDHEPAHLAYITDAEQNLLINKDMYGSLDGTPNRGPSGIPSLQGDMGSIGGGSRTSGGGGGGGEGAGNVSWQPVSPTPTPTPTQRAAASEDIITRSIDEIIAASPATGPAHDPRNMNVNLREPVTLSPTSIVAPFQNRLGIREDPRLTAAQLTEGDIGLTDLTGRADLLTEGDIGLRDLTGRADLLTEGDIGLGLNAPVYQDRILRIAEGVEPGYRAVDERPFGLTKEVALEKGKITQDQYDATPVLTLDRLQDPPPIDPTGDGGTGGGEGAGGIGGGVAPVAPATGTGVAALTDFAAAKAEAIEAAKAKAPFEHYYVGGAPTAEQTAFMQAHRAAPSMVGLEQYAAQGGRMGYAGGGISDLRQGYGLGSIVKKVTRAVKKIAKSPVGMAALMAVGLPALGKYGAAKGWGGFGSGSFMGTLGGSGGWKAALMGQKGIPGVPGQVGKYATSSLLDRIKGNPWPWILGASAVGGATAEEEDELQGEAFDRGPGLDIIGDRRKILAGGVKQEDFPFLDPKYYAAQGGRIGAQEGGLMDLGGMEKDYRQEGGFVPIGGQERADDVPARLSKNEFVFTADAVRAAGGGDIDAGAEVMENVMENLEQGGQVSEESQGLEGARNMFATAQRLEGVM